jgi:DNA helicase-2/ATP-dependent DNA helicase PcrA
MEFLNQLNDIQRQAVEAKDGPSLIVAGAGSGKTRVLTYRIAYLLASGVPPWNILSLTFTNKAAKEMKERIATIVGADLAGSLWMGTFHSIFSKILRIEAERLGYPPAFTIYDTADSKSLLKSIIKDLKLDDKAYNVGGVLSRISMAKNNLVTAEAYKGNQSAIETDRMSKRPEIYKIYQLYAMRCRKAGAMDFDDLLLNTNILFRDYPDVLEKYQNKFKYILVDEYQDTNFAQYLIIKKLSQQHQNISVVGDDAQSIYSFRGAKIENILNFKNDYPQHRLFKLEQNYRSTQTIVNAANSLIAKNEKQIPKVVFSENDEGELIKLMSAYTDKEEGFKVVSDIYDHTISGTAEYSDMAILYRTNAQSRIFEEALRKRNIPYKIYGGLSFYQRKEIKDLVAYFRMVVNPDDDEALKRIINYPTRGIGATTVGKIEVAANENNISLWEVLNNPAAYGLEVNKGTANKLQSFVTIVTKFISEHHKNDAYDMARLIAGETGILKELSIGKTIEERTRHENVEELLNGIRDFVTTNYSDEGGMVLLSQFLENVALLTDQDNEKDQDMNKVTLMTIHSSKGLEFPYVYIVGMEEELFPSGMSVHTQHELEEERRLFYVALTRAERKAYLSYCGSRFKYGTPVSTSPSRFIRDIDPEYIEQDSPFGSSGQSFGGFKKKVSAVEGSVSGNSSSSMSFKKPVRLGAKTMGNRPVMRKMGNVNPNFKADPPEMIKSGLQVEHQQFGIGRVLQVIGDNNDKKAVIFFPDYGEKKLLLKFAKLRVVN